MGLTGDCFQRFIAGTQQVTLQDRGVSGQVKGSLAVEHVGNRDQTYFFSLSGLLKRAQCRLFFLKIGFQQFLGTQHIEISHGDAHDQVLFLGREIYCGRAVTGLGALEGIPVRQVDHALVEV